MNTAIRLTQYSHGAGCGCKISPQVLETILHSQLQPFNDPRLLVGNESRDDAAVWDLGNGSAIVSTTDFFMPVVDDPHTFGRIAATNAISDIYAMGGKPVMAIAILGWPVNVLEASVAQAVVDGGVVSVMRRVLHWRGHSIDAPEPIFGLAVTGIVPVERVKRNNAAQAGCLLFLSKPLGIGVLTTAEKKGLLQPQHQGVAAETMCQLNHMGARFAGLPGVMAMTDVTGFGLLGHLSEICLGSRLRAELRYQDVPVLPGVSEYIAQGCVPGGTGRNFASYGQHVTSLSDDARALLCDPQTSGGLLVAVKPDTVTDFLACADAGGQQVTAIGRLLPADDRQPLINVQH